MSYTKLEIWQVARQQVIDIYQMTESLPKSEMYGVTQQIRRSANSVMANLAEGYGRKDFAGDHLKFVIYVLTPNDETMSHLQMIRGNGLLSDELKDQQLRRKAVHVGVKINNFKSALEIPLAEKRKNDHRGQSFLRKQHFCTETDLCHRTTPHD